MQIFKDELTTVTSILAVNKYSNTYTQIKEKQVVCHGSTDEYCQLIFFLYGDNRTRYGDVTVRDCENSMRFLPAVKTDTYTVERQSADCCIDVYFTTDRPLSQIAVGYLDKGFLKNKFLKLYNLWSKKKQGYYFKSMSVFYEIIEALISSEDSYISTLQKKALDKAHDYIIRNYTCTGFDYNALCQASGFSYSYFKSLFRSRYNMSPVKYVTKMRLSRACELLLSGDFSVTEVAEMCGFENVYYFSSVFKKHIGVSPSRYYSDDGTE